MIKSINLLISTLGLILSFVFITSCGDDDNNPPECISCASSAFAEIIFCQEGNNVISTINSVAGTSIYVLENTTLDNYQQVYESQGYTCVQHEQPQPPDLSVYDYCAECSMTDQLSGQLFEESFCQDGDDLVVILQSGNIQFIESYTSTTVTEHIQNLESSGYNCQVTSSPPCETCTLISFDIFSVTNHECQVEVCVDGATILNQENCDAAGGGSSDYNSNGSQSEIVSDLISAGYICGDYPSDNCVNCTFVVNGVSFTKKICEGINGKYAFTYIDNGIFLEFKQAIQLDATTTFDSVIQQEVNNGYTCL